MDKLKIFHIAGISGRGGTGASALKMAVKLHEKGHNIIFACFPKSVLHHQLEKSGISVITDIKMQGKFKFKKKYFQSFFKDI